MLRLGPACEGATIFLKIQFLILAIEGGLSSLLNIFLILFRTDSRIICGMLSSHFASNGRMDYKCATFIRSECKYLRSVCRTDPWGYLDWFLGDAKARALVRASESVLRDIHFHWQLSRTKYSYKYRYIQPNAAPKLKSTISASPKKRYIAATTEEPRGVQGPKSTYEALGNHAILGKNRWPAGNLGDLPFTWWPTGRHACAGSTATGHQVPR